MVCAVILSLHQKSTENRCYMDIHFIHTHHYMYLHYITCGLDDDWSSSYQMTKLMKKNHWINCDKLAWFSLKTPIAYDIKFTASLIDTSMSELRKKSRKMLRNHKNFFIQYNFSYPTLKFIHTKKEYTLQILDWIEKKIFGTRDEIVI